MANVSRLVQELRAALVQARENRPGAVIRAVPNLLPLIGELYDTPAVTDWRGERQGDVGGGDCYLQAKGLRDEISAIPLHAGVGGVPFDPAFLVATLEYLMRLLER